MLTKLTIRNFKRFKEAVIDLSRNVVFVGQNNSGKTTALQALALWDIGLRAWLSKRVGKISPEKRPGVIINRRDLHALPVPSADLLWNDLHVRGRLEGKTKNIRIDVIVEGVSEGQTWSCGFEFDYSNEASFACRPVRQPGYEDKPVKECKFTDIPDILTQQSDNESMLPRIAYLPPMSGLAAEEPKWEPGRIDVLIGQGQTAQVLRNLCHQIASRADNAEWKALCNHLKSLFGVTLLSPEHIAARGEIVMRYEDANGTELDLSCSGRGMQQTLLLLAHLYINPHSALLLDEPDAHLEILRQRQIYNVISSVAEKQGSQIITASHSEVVLNEAVGRGTVVAFIGKPHVINDRGSQVLKALTDIGFEHYLNAQQKGWVIYLENASDLKILQEFAVLLKHPAASLLDKPYYHYLATNLPNKARDHFFGLREAKSDLVGIAIFDRLDKELKKEGPLCELMWRRKEIENYFCREDVLLAFVADVRGDGLFERAEKVKRVAVMKECILSVSEASKVFEKPDIWSADLKASEDVLAPIFQAFSKKMGIPLALKKNEFSQLAKYMKPEMFDLEITEKLDAIVDVAKKARPLEEME